MAMVRGRIPRAPVLAGAKAPMMGLEATAKVIHVMAKWKATKLS